MKKLTSVLLLIAICLTCVFAVSAEEGATVSEDGFVTVVRTYNLKEADFVADSSVINFNFSYTTAAAFANITFGSIELLCDGEAVETYALNQTFAKGSATTDFGASGTVAIPKGDHTLTVRLNVKVTDADAAWLETDVNVAPFFLWGQGLTEGAKWVIVASNMISAKEMLNGTPGADGFVTVVRTYNLKEADFVADSSVINFNFSYTTAAVPANITFDSLELLSDGATVETYALDKSFTKGGATTDFGASGTVAVPKGDHTLTVKLRVKVTDADAAWLESEVNVAPFFLWGQGLTEGAKWVIVASNMISAKEMLTGTVEEGGDSGDTDNGYVPDPDYKEENNTPGEFVWVNRTYELKNADFKNDFSIFFFRMWWQFGDTENKTTGADITVKEIQVWVDGELLESHAGTGFSKIMVEGDTSNTPAVTRNEEDKTLHVAKGATCMYDQLQFYTDGINPVERGDHTITFRVCVKVENISGYWNHVLNNNGNNAFVCNFWGDGLHGEYWLTAWGQDGAIGTIITKEECLNGSSDNDRFEQPDQGGNEGGNEDNVTTEPVVTDPTTPNVTTSPATTTAKPTTTATPNATETPGTQASAVTEEEGCASVASALPLMLLIMGCALPAICRKKEQ